ncbi:unnamed protein product [Phaeothamnion confervicola]
MSAAGSGVAVYAEGQDLGELFDVYLPPAALGVQETPPRPTGVTRPRSAVHRDGDWHRAVHVWLVNDKGELLLQRRSHFKDTFPDKWDVSVGGHLTSGDGSLETAIKEVAEELGLSVAAADLRLLFTVATSAEGETSRHGIFCCNEYKDVYITTAFNGPANALKAAPGEVSELRWLEWRAVAAAMRAGEGGSGGGCDPAYVPRAAAYVDALAAELAVMTGSGS